MSARSGAGLDEQMADGRRLFGAADYAAALGAFEAVAASARAQLRRGADARGGAADEDELANAERVRVAALNNAAFSALRAGSRRRELISGLSTPGINESDIHVVHNLEYQGDLV